MRIVILAAVFAAAPALASDRDDVVAKVTHYFTTPGDVAAAAYCAPGAVIIDDFAPYVWSGRTACADWARDIGAAAKTRGIVFGNFTLGKMHRVDISGDRAYVVVPVGVALTVRGEPKTSNGNTVTVALHKTSGWMITGWSWAKN